MTQYRRFKSAVTICVACASLLLSQKLFAHCDTMDGPVVKAARSALESNNVALVLLWVQPADEAVIRAAFTKTMAVRTQSPAAKELADMYFFETVVRIHRAGEGVAYTGLKPAGAEIEHGIEAADKALQAGSDAELGHHLTDVVRKGVQKRFTNAFTKSKFKPSDVAAGREYVKAYVEFIHYVEGVFNAAGAQIGHAHPVNEVDEHRH